LGAVVLGMDGQRRGRAVVTPLPAALDEPMSDPEGLGEPPAALELSPEAQLAWRRLAPYALKERTLVVSRTPGFAKLCLEWAYCAAFEARIQTLGVTSSEADRLLKRLNDYKKLLRNSLGDFNLKAFGKPVTPEKPKVSTNPFAALGGAKG